MFFSGDASARKKVDLGGRSNKERDREKLLEQARIQREQRLRARIENHSALKIQKCFRGRKTVAAERSAVRNQFFACYGERGEKASRNAFKPDSKYLPELFFFFRLSNEDSLHCLVGVCQFLQQLSAESGYIRDLFTNGDYGAYRALVDYRVKTLVYLCMQTLHHHRELLKMELSCSDPGNFKVNRAMILLETVLMLTDTSLPWSGATIDFLVQMKIFCLFRDLVLTIWSPKEAKAIGETNSLLQTSFMLALRHFERIQGHESMQAQYSFATQILSIPLLWLGFPSLKLACANQRLWANSVHQLATSATDLHRLLPLDLYSEFPSQICLLGNLLEVAGLALNSQVRPSQLAVNFILVSRCLMDGLPPSCFRPSTAIDDGTDVIMEDGSDTALQIENQLKLQICSALTGDLFKNLVRLSFIVDESSRGLLPSAEEARVVGEISSFFYAVLSTFPSEVVAHIAYNTDLIPMLWQYVERCHVGKQWPDMPIAMISSCNGQTSIQTNGWMLPLSVLCPVYSYKLMSIDNEEFYEQQKPLRLDALRQLVLILKEALWQILWVMPSKAAMQKDPARSSKIFSFHSLEQWISNCLSRLLSELQDWNNRRQFMPPNEFHVKEAIDENFLTQAEHENTRARELLTKAPFLVPFIQRVRIYTSQLSAARPQSMMHGLHSRLRIRIKRDQIVEDAFSQLSTLPADALKGVIRVTFLNEFGAEEAGVDGGGMFKDFMEQITKSAFDVQYGLFKETASHFLYPNPASQMVHDEHLSYFEFLGKILGKAMFEGILVDIPFATFFLSKLKKKHNYLHDLPSLDADLYRNLLFLKHYEDLTKLELYFIIEDNEYGEHLEVELVENGKNTQVTNTNVIRYIHLVANHRLNSQICQQSYYFLRGFQQLMKPEWIDMFNEHELQILISGSIDGLDIDDLRANTNYSGGYSEHHPVIEAFWEVLKAFELSLQHKFLKFVTGCSRGPLLGFKYLEPKFCIQRAAPEEATEDMLDRLPTSATCMNLLKLPPYRRKETIREKLIYAITAEAGFDLS